MSASASKSEAKTSESTVVDTRNLNQSGNTGITLLASEDSSTSLTQNTSTLIRDSGNTNTRDSNNSTQITLNDNSEANRSVSDLANLISSASTGVANHALDIAKSTNSDSLDFARDSLGTTQSVLERLNSNFIAAVSSFENSSQTTLANTVSSLNQISAEQNKSGNQLVVDATLSAQNTATEGLVNVFKWLALAVVAALATKAVLGKLA